MKQQNGMIQGLLKESNSSREELHSLRCLTKIKAEERGQKHRERLRAEVHFKHTHTKPTHETNIHMYRKNNTKR